VLITEVGVTKTVLCSCLCVTCTAQVVDKLQADTDKWLANLTIHGYRFT